MESWYSFVIGIVAFCYIKSFNRNAKLYLESEKTLSWNDLFTKVVPVLQSHPESNWGFRGQSPVS